MKNIKFETWLWLFIGLINLIAAISCLYTGDYFKSIPNIIFMILSPWVVYVQIMDTRINWSYHNYIKYRLIKKSDSKFMKILGFILKPINKSFMISYTTTIGHTIYTSSSGISKITLLHEIEHVRQWEKWGILFSLSYLLVLPLGITMRGYWERQAYEVTIRERYKRYPDNWTNDPDFKNHILSQFTSSNYLWMDLRKEYLSKWFDNIIKDIVNEAATNNLINEGF